MPNDNIFHIIVFFGIPASLGTPNIEPEPQPSPEDVVEEAPPESDIEP